MALIGLPEEPSVPDQERAAHKNWITEDWFQTFGTRLLVGRNFQSEDRLGAPLVAIVNQTFAERFLADGDALGRTVREDRRSDGVEERMVVGIVEDAVYRSIREPAPPTMYVPLSQATRLPPSFNIALRPVADGDPAGLAESLRAALLQVSPGLKVTVRRLDEQIKATYNQERLLAMFSIVFGSLAMIMAALGLFSVTAYAVSRQRREIGIRMALGADARRVVRKVLSRVAVMVALGIATGGVLSLWAVRFVESLLFGLPPREPSVFVGAAALLMLSAAVASWQPARRAARVDPASVLRED